MNVNSCHFIIAIQVAVQDTMKSTWVVCRRVCCLLENKLKKGYDSPITNITIVL